MQGTYTHLLRRHGLTLVFLIAIIILFLVYTEYISNSGLLLGKKIPEVEFQHLDGTPLPLSAHLGKDIVVVDFWASWCGPCQMSLPGIAALSKKYSGKGAVVYAVNWGESRDDVEKFLKKSSMNLPAVMDNRDLSRSIFHVYSIPQTFIIDKDGVVQRIYPGYGLNQEMEISGDIDALLSGKALLNARP